MKINIYIPIALLLLTFVFTGVVVAQDNMGGSEQPRGMRRPMPNQPGDNRNNLLRRLGLSADQISKIRQLNIERKPLMNEAQMRFRKANRAMDEAIYADTINASDIQARLNEVQLAQAELSKIRYMNELEVRKILTPEQLVQFRELRTRFEQRRGRFQNRRELRGPGPAGRRGRDAAPRPDRGVPAVPEADGDNGEDSRD